MVKGQAHEGQGRKGTGQKYKISTFNLLPKVKVESLKVPRSKVVGQGHTVNVKVVGGCFYPIFLAGGATHGHFHGKHCLLATQGGVATFACKRQGLVYLPIKY